MAEIQSRPSATASRGRTSGRGRGGLASRGGGRARASHANGDSFEDDADAALKQQYATEISQLKEIFPDWSEFDLASALQQTSGDIDGTVEGITTGSIQKWGEVPKKHHSRAKATKDASPTASDTTSSTRPARGGRTEAGRGRGRGAERGGRGGSSRGRGASHAATNGSRHKENQALSVPTAQAWGDSTTSSDAAAGDEPTKDAPSPAKRVTPVAPKPAAPPVKTWASMLRQSTQPKPAPKPIETPTPKPPTQDPEPAPIETTAAEPEVVVPELVEEPEAEKEVVEAAGEPEPKTELSQKPPTEPQVVPTVIEPEVALPPPKDQLTEVNLEQVADSSHPPATVTAASTAADSWDPHQEPPTSSATPVSASQQQAQVVAARSALAATAPIGSGYAASAQKATERLARGPSHHQRRILDQEEAVRMPGSTSNRDVDRTAVQFGAFNLGFAEDDVDEDREEAETRAQPPADSPVAHPRTSLPPAQPAPVPDTFPTGTTATQTAIPTVPPTAATSIPTGPSSASVAAASVPTGPASTITPQPPAGAPTQPAAAAAAAAAVTATPTSQQQPPQAPQQYGRFPQTTGQDQTPTGFPQKPFDSFAGQSSTPSMPQAQSQFDTSLPAATQAQQPSIQQSTGGAFTSGPNDYPYYSTADQASRGQYGGYYNQGFNAQQGQQQQPVGQPGIQGQTPGQQESTLAPQQRGFGGYGGAQADSLSQYPQSATQASRFGATTASDAQNSGHNTPNPTQNQPSTGPGSQGPSHQQQPHNQPQQQQQGGYGGYQQHPYFNNPYYSNFMYGGNNYGGNYGAPYGKGGVYGQPHQYGMNPQGPFDHSASGNTGFGQASLHRGDSGLSSGLGGGDFQRGGSNQSTSQPGLGGSSFGGAGMHDSFSRGSSTGYPAQGSYNSQASQPGSVGAGTDELKPYGDSKTAGGPSPSMSAAARPGSAANTGASQTGLPPPGTGHQGAIGGSMGGYGAYPSHLQGQYGGLHGNQTGNSGYGMGGGAGGQGQGNAGFPGYNQYGGNSYYNNQQRGGWSSNYH